MMCNYRLSLHLVELKRIAIFLINDVKLVLVTDTDLVIALQPVD